MTDWPELTEARDRPTIVALHLFSQVVGKVPTALLPWRNHGWHLTLHVTPRGVRTEPVSQSRWSCHSLKSEPTRIGETWIPSS